ncbi:MAG: hypothetical protein QOE12_540 [Mycobacterium sp.]|nr:hypothetical protein [Mycobacterium sp.]MDT7733366.1 hypothetical protein [Mycobacterium sp.]
MAVWGRQSALRPMRQLLAANHHFVSAARALATTLAGGLPVRLSGKTHGYPVAEIPP